MSVSQVTTTLAASLDVVSPRGTLVRPLSAITRTLVPLLGALKGHERKHTWRGKALGGFLGRVCFLHVCVCCLLGCSVEEMEQKTWHLLSSLRIKAVRPWGEGWLKVNAASGGTGLLRLVHPQAGKVFEHDVVVIVGVVRVLVTVALYRLHLLQGVHALSLDGSW